jgi:hypothetical protein
MTDHSGCHRPTTEEAPMGEDHIINKIDLDKESELSDGTRIRLVTPPSSRSSTMSRC